MLGHPRSEFGRNWRPVVSVKLQVLVHICYIAILKAPKEAKWTILAHFDPKIGGFSTSKKFESEKYF